MNWRDLVIARPGYSIQANNRWLTNWVAFRAKVSKEGRSFRLVRIASKRLVFEVENELANDQSSRFKLRWLVMASVFVSLSIAVAAFVTSLERAPANQALPRAMVTEAPRCIELQSFAPTRQIEDEESFAIQGWQLKRLSTLLSLGQLASADYKATCMNQEVTMRVLLIRQSDSWQIEKMAPTK